jgi:hypothetical protein
MIESPLPWFGLPGTIHFSPHASIPEVDEYAFRANCPLPPQSLKEPLVNIKKTSTSLLAACILALFTGAAHAASIPLNNPSFETLPQGGIGGLFDIGAIPGWTNSGVSGQFQPAGPLGTSLNSYFNYLPDGPTIAYTNAFTIYQGTNALVQSGYTYTLTVQLGHRLDEHSTQVPHSR